MQDNNVNVTLHDRGRRYGPFKGHAVYTQSMKRCFRDSPNWHRMRSDQQEALDMIAHKIGRILNGDPDYGDSWHDIAGYATLIEKRLDGEIR